MPKMKKVFDTTYKKGAVYDDFVEDALRKLALISHKPTEEESELVNGDVGDMSYWTVYDKGFRIVLYIEE